MSTIAFRVDASPAIGTGHAMRCFALAQAAKDRGHRPVFLMAETGPSFDDRLRNEGFELVRIPGTPASGEDAKETIQAARDRQSAWLVVDGYRFEPSYLDALKGAGLSVLAIDDYGHTRGRSADMILNQNLHARPDMYPERTPGTRLLLGPRYVVLRREFRVQKRRTRVRYRARTILVTLGGVDPHNVTEIVLRGIAKLGTTSTKVRVIVGPMNDRRATLESLVRDLGRRAKLEPDVDAVAPLFAQADIAVAAGGTTAWELAYMGVPSLLIVLSENQRDVAESLDRAGVAESLGPWDTMTPERVARGLRPILVDRARRKTMARGGKSLVDGVGVDRVVRALSAPHFTLRPAQEADARRVWEWSNERGARKASFSTHPIPWADHVKWYRAKLADPRCQFYVAVEPGGRDVGLIRFDLQDRVAEVSVNLDSGVRGRGYGAAVIHLGSQKVFAESDVKTIRAYAKQSNEGSIAAFLDAGYEDGGDTIVRGHRARELVLTREAGA